MNDLRVPDDRCCCSMLHTDCRWDGRIRHTSDGDDRTPRAHTTRHVTHAYAPCLATTRIHVLRVARTGSMVCLCCGPGTIISRLKDVPHARCGPADHTALHPGPKWGAHARPLKEWPGSRRASRSNDRRRQSSARYGQTIRSLKGERQQAMRAMAK